MPFLSKQKPFFIKFYIQKIDFDQNKIKMLRCRQFGRKEYPEKGSADASQILKFFYEEGCDYQ